MSVVHPVCFVNVPHHVACIVDHLYMDHFVTLWTISSPISRGPQQSKHYDGNPSTRQDLNLQPWRERPGDHNVTLGGVYFFIPPQQTHLALFQNRKTEFALRGDQISEHNGQFSNYYLI